MASDSPQSTQPTGGASASGSLARRDDAWGSARSILAPLASLKLTVVLFALAIFIVLAGTLGQTQGDIWQIIDHYFRMPRNVDAYVGEPWGWFHAAFAEIQFKIFFPKSFFPDVPDYAWMENHFYFPKGWLIGAMMFVNLVAAHAVRFRMQASGPRLAAGSIVLALGMLVTYAVIHTGAIGDDEGVQDAAWLSWGTIWLLIKLSLAALWFVGAAAVVRMDPSRGALRIGLGVGELLFGSALLWLFFAGGDFALGESSMRILWQLIKATGAGVVLLVGCILAFKQRAGIVLLHAGVGLMMFSELLVGVSAVESQLSAQEGQAKNYSEDTRGVELAVVDPSNAETDDVVVVEDARLRRDEVVSDDALPFDVRLVEFIENVPRLRNIGPHEDNPATAGVGLVAAPVAEKRSVGTDSNQKVDVPAAYVELISKDDEGKSLGTYLLSVIQMATWLESEQRPERVTVGDKTYEVSLRFKRIYRPFWIEVLDARQDNYTGTSMARNYSSDVRIVDADGSELLATRIWMNNPLRFRGETYYQSEFRAKGMPGVEADTTTLQVVTNKGWMIPYVSCMIVAVGMLHQFSMSLFRFVRRRSRAVPATVVTEAATTGSPLDERMAAVEGAARKQRRPRREPDVVEDVELGRLPAATWLPLAVVIVAALWVGSKAARPLPEHRDMNIEAAGKLPVMEAGRCKPLDTVARSTLRVLAKRETFLDSNETRQPAIRWLLDVISGLPAGEDHRVFRIENFDVLDALGLEPRKGLLYSVREIQKGQKTFDEALRKAAEVREKNPKDFTLGQQQIIEFANRFAVYENLVRAFHSPADLPELPKSDSVDDVEKARSQIATKADAFSRELEIQRHLAERNAPLAVPATTIKGEAGWTTLVGSYVDEYIHKLASAELAERTEATRPSEARAHWAGLLEAYRAGEAQTFNDAVRDYRDYLDSHTPDAYGATRVDYESFFSRMEPFFVASWLYLGVAILAIGALFGWSLPLNRSAFWLAAFTLVLHTFAIASRVYISGRPPVTTLYSSAVFIGWGAVALALAMEAIFRLGLGNLLAGIMGSATLLVAHFLSLDGDTFPMLQAVLDTQFWLATHVVTVTAGYAATFVAGVLGVLFVVLGLCTPALDKEMSKVLARMIYGSLCFAIFFSFVGTVLGGLWADDSWGRFWGWDPKENGALIIVLWNALVLHARWDGWVKDRGMAVMAMVGNVVTAWSWFGVNNLGVGLHSYGKSEDAINALLIFWVAQLAVVGLGMLPKSCWWSFQNETYGGSRVKTTRGGV